MLNVRLGAAILALVLTLTTGLTPGPALAASAAEIDRDVTRAIQDMYAEEPKSKELVATLQGDPRVPHHPQGRIHVRRAIR